MAEEDVDPGITLETIHQLLTGIDGRLRTIEERMLELQRQAEQYKIDASYRDAERRDEAGGLPGREFAGLAHREETRNTDVERKPTFEHRR